MAAKATKVGAEKLSGTDSRLFRSTLRSRGGFPAQPTLGWIAGPGTTMTVLNRTEVCRGQFSRVHALRHFPVKK